MILKSRASARHRVKNMYKKIIVNTAIAKHTTVTGGFRPSESKPSGTRKKNSEFTDPLRKPGKRHRAQAFG